jgi:enoyl-CoA hydratase
MTSAAATPAGEDVPEIKSEVMGRLGVITLDRPKALNALNLPMVTRLEAVLDAWAADAAVDAVLIRSGSDRAFCAGGDVRSIGILPDPADRMALGRAFFGTEYRVNLRINTFPKPFIALINGIVMGGGLGVSIHGSHRVVSETVRMAMPETVLGLFPDVGASWFLNRCPGALGRYIALIGPHLTAGDALDAGLATHHVPFAAFNGLVSTLAAGDSIDSLAVDHAIAVHAGATLRGELAERQDVVDRLFGGSDLNRVVANIDAAVSEAGWIGEARAVLGRASPISLRATWRRMVQGKGQSIQRILADDYRMAVRIVGGEDFAEGVRAILVDKDNAPRWTRSTLADVTEDVIDELLAPMNGEPEAEMVLEVG